MITTKIHISGMTCSACTNSIKHALEQSPGVSGASVSLLTEEASINHSSNITPGKLLEIIENIGFDANLISSVQDQTFTTGMENTITTYIQIGGMTCSSCTNSVANSLSDLAGVKSVEVSLITEEATVIHTANVSPEELAHKIEDIGFDATVVSSSSNTKPHKQYKTEMNIGGMTCSSCVDSVSSTLENTSGVYDVKVSLMTEKAVVIHDESVSVDELKQVVQDCGFEATIVGVEEINSKFNSADLNTISLRIYGMTCSSCVNTIESQVNKLNGVLDCKISLTVEEAKITFEADVIGIRDIIKTIEDCGFDAILQTNLDTTNQLDLLAKVKDIQYWKKNFFRLLWASLPIIFLSHILPLIKKSCHWSNDNLKLFPGVYLDILMQLIIGTFVQFYLGKRFYINSYKAISHGSGSMDVLICTSTSIIYFYSVICIITSFFKDTYPSVLFDTAAMLFTFVSLGKWVESRAKGNTSTALSKLLSLTPSSCIIVKNPELFNNSKGLDSSLIIQQNIGVDLLQKNDITVILPGSKIPCDGECIFGSSEVDESLLTGESIPVKKISGSKLIGGTVNTSSTLYMRVLKLGEHTQLQQIVKLVKDAQIAKAPVQRFADSVASIFVPCILCLSLLTLCFWSMFVWCRSRSSIPLLFVDPDDHHILFSRILQVSISVIVVACPCALGLAAPTAVMVGTGVGASNGVLIKGGEILEKASKVDCIIFDKTGTITDGKMKLSKYDFIDESGAKDHLIWSLLYAIESNSEHPIAKAIVSGAILKLDTLRLPPLPVKFDSIDTHAGLGLSVLCRIEEFSKDPMLIKLGNQNFINESKLSNSNEFNGIIEKLSGSSKISSFCHILIDDKYNGYVELSDSLKPDAKNVIATLINNGYAVGMVTGDSIGTSTHVAKLVNIPLSNVLAESSPEQKLQYVELLRSKKGLNVAFVGDGINDAPALVQADVGIAISSGTDIAMSAADIVLLSSDHGAESNDQNISSSNGLGGVLSGLDISKRTFKVIKMNFLLAVVYNMIMLPIAMGLLIVPFSITLNPMFASAAMACSSISVILNSLTLKWWNPKSYQNKIDSFENDREDILYDNRADISILDVEGFKCKNDPPLKKSFLRRLFDKFNFRINRIQNENYQMLSTISE